MQRLACLWTENDPSRVLNRDLCLDTSLVNPVKVVLEAEDICVPMNQEYTGNSILDNLSQFDSHHTDIFSRTGRLRVCGVDLLPRNEFTSILGDHFKADQMRILFFFFSLHLKFQNECHGRGRVGWDLFSCCQAKTENKPNDWIKGICNHYLEGKLEDIDQTSRLKYHEYKNRGSTGRKRRNKGYGVRNNRCSTHGYGLGLAREGLWQSG
ncbi:hypothetical protein L1987_47741 [Smallanthus sonchifolius]|uniref:Uncharacterized protein n=1 Tax=Smallanthus sonchifolius TaxID=185202 RepID=A0ACB9G3C8_9ASTR|nr:hypothetical protein L1987_47741 [Smallanthus sonchifolius]